jgi:hypothetical protein
MTMNIKILKPYETSSEMNNSPPYTNENYIL